MAGVDFLSEMIDHDVDDVRAGVKVVAPRVLGDECPAHDASGVAHQVFEDCVFLGSELNRLAAPDDLAGVEMKLEVGDF